MVNETHTINFTANAINWEICVDEDGDVLTIDRLDRDFSVAEETMERRWPESYARMCELIDAAYGA